MSNNSLIDLNDLTPENWKQIAGLALQIKERPEDYMDVCHGKIMATVFYEPSTRTQMSFQTAMLRLGGKVISIADPKNSSVSKGETLKDTMVMMGSYADVIAMRHPREGAALAASLYTPCPVINAGDGGHLHPTQTLTDLTTLMAKKGRLDGLTIGFCGDLKYGRTIHSLIKALSCFPNNRFVLISTRQLTVPAYIQDLLNRSGCSWRFAQTLEDQMGGLDVLYMTRIQRERFLTPEDYEKQKGVYVLTEEKIANASPEMIVMHPLPRVDEIDVTVDEDPRAVYFQQAVYGMYARMALLIKLFGKEITPVPGWERRDGCRCKNPLCITNSEGYLPALWHEQGGKMLCKYCDESLS